jgi:hypothetical protein
MHRAKDCAIRRFVRPHSQFAKSAFGLASSQSVIDAPRPPLVTPCE